MKKLLLFILLALQAFGGREFLSASTEFGAKTTPITTYPVTISGWFFPYSTNAIQVIAFIGDSGTSTRRFLLYYSTARTLVADTIPNTGGSANAATSTTTANTNAWHHALAVFDSATSRRVYLNGAGSATNTTSTTTSGLTTFAVGARNNLGTWGISFNGVLAEVAVWTNALSASAIAELAGGASPEIVSPGTRCHLLPLTGQESGSEIDMHGVQLGLTNTPAPSTLHPRIYRP